MFYYAHSTPWQGKDGLQNRPLNGLHGFTASCYVFMQAIQTKWMLTDYTDVHGFRLIRSCFFVRPRSPGLFLIFAAVSPNPLPNHFVNPFRPCFLCDYFMLNPIVHVLIAFT